MNKILNDAEKKEIEEKVYDVLTQFGFDFENDTRVDTVKLANSLGFTIGESNMLPDNEDGFIFVSPCKDRKVIGINYCRTMENKRFITAYQLAYYFLYPKELRETIMIRNNIRDRDDAYYFAECLLNPKSVAKRSVKETKKENDITGLYLRNIDDNEIYKIYDITYDSAGYPHFLVFKKNQWIRMSAKHFRPLE